MGHLWLAFRPNPFSGFGDQVSPHVHHERTTLKDVETLLTPVPRRVVRLCGMDLGVGSRVAITGECDREARLPAARSHNGQRGRVVSWDATNSTWEVEGGERMDNGGARQRN